MVSIADRQGPSKVKGELKDSAALDPHRSHIACVQLYAGGDHAFVVRGPALKLLLRSAWFRHQRFISHNAVFEISFLDYFYARSRPAADVLGHNRMHDAADRAGDRLPPLRLWRAQSGQRNQGDRQDQGRQEFRH